MNVFIPSTIYLEDPPIGFSEYIAAKAAVEAYALHFCKRNTSWKIATPRLPRVLTDQTAAIARETPVQTVEIILKRLEELYSSENAKK